MPSLVRTIRFTRGRLPHWEIENGRHFVTVRCQDSLPAAAVSQLREINETLQSIEPSSPPFARWQHRYFRTMEKYLDAGHGEAALRHSPVAELLANEFAGLAREGFAAPHFTIMPNHWHVLLRPLGEGPSDLHATVSRLKGRTARVINARLGRSGPFWQREWFDRWIRDDGEWDRCVDYIRNNPVKAGLARHWSDHPWTR